MHKCERIKKRWKIIQSKYVVINCLCLAKQLCQTDIFEPSDEIKSNLVICQEKNKKDFLKKG